MIKKILKTALGIICSYIVVVLIFSDEIMLGWGYEIKGSGGDNYYNRIHITKDGKTVLEPAIKDYQVVDGYLVAFSIPTKEIVCEYKPMLIYIDKPIYHILELESAAVTSFNTRETFEEQLRTLSLLKDMELDYSILERFFLNEHARLDNKDKYTHCIENLDLIGTKVIRYM